MYKVNILIANHKGEKVQRLRELLQQYDHGINVVANPVSVAETIDYLQKCHEQVDVAFFETKLSDGSTFEIFKKLNIKIPVVFTSSSEKDAFKAIKANGLDYLLEPLVYTDIEQVLTKVLANQGKDFLEKHCHSPNSQTIKKRFLVKYGYKMHYKTLGELAYFYAEGKMVYFVTRTTGRSYIVDYTLDDLEGKHLDPESLFRINRKYIIHIDVIEEVRSYANSRLKVVLNPPAEKDMIVSRDKVSAFKNWLNL